LFATRLDVLDGGALTIVQDLGRWGYTHLGVPVCGPMDPFAFRAANLLVGNEIGAASLEITAVGPSLRIDGECFIALAGGDLGAVLDGQQLHPWKPYLARWGSEVAFVGRREGGRAYLAITGGIDVTPWLGSRSTYLPGRLGGYRGRAVKAGDALPIARTDRIVTRVPLEGLANSRRPAYRSDPTLRVILGPHVDRFTPRGIETFLQSEYRLTEQSDRMGYRLEGPPISLSASADISSCGTPLGAIQVPGSGKPILLMADHQTAGGYPLIGAVIQADIPLAAQCLPGDPLRFRAVDLREAQDSLREQHAALEQLSVPAA
jgi:antagonist of KipI